MALRGSPMGILLIASGVILLNLAYTGRGHDVWAALTQGGTPDAAKDSTGASDSATSTSTNTNLTVQQAAQTAAIGINTATTPKVFKRTAATCPNGYWNVRAPGGDVYCVVKGDASVAYWNDEGKSCGAGNITGFATDNNRGICVKLGGTGAGQATDAPTNIIPHPVGFGTYERMSPSVTAPGAGWGVR